MTEYLEVKQPNISQIAESFINTNTNNEINPSSSNNIENSENSNLFNISFLRELRPFKCNFPGCNRDYSNKSRLEIHVRTHTGDKPFQCEKCGKSFNEKGNLKIHYRIHTGEKPYKCSYQGCYKEFKAYGHLSDHLKRHFNIRPFKCDICNSSFSRRNTLKTHIMTHTGEKPHKCTFPGCHKRFSEKGNMKTHYKTHTKNQKKKFSYNENLLGNEEHLGVTFPARIYKPEKEYLESPKVQRCAEYSYVCSKTGSSTTLCPLDKKQKNDNLLHIREMNEIKEIQDEETEYCATPIQHHEESSSNPIFSQRANDISINKTAHTTPSPTKKVITIENFTERFTAMKHSVNFNSISNNNKNSSDNSCQKTMINNNNSLNASNNNNLFKNSNAYNNEKILSNLKKNYLNNHEVCINTNNNMKSTYYTSNQASAVFFENNKLADHQRLSPENSGNSTANTNIPEIRNYSSPCDSPLPMNICSNIELKTSCLSNYNQIFNEEYFNRQNNFNYRNSLNDLLGDDEDFYQNFGYNGLINNNNNDYASLITSDWLK